MKKLYLLTVLSLFGFSSFAQCGFTISLSSNDISCFGVCDGSATVSASGGTGPYTYVWNPGGATGSSITGLCESTYWCVVEDGLGCKDSTSFDITEPPQLINNPIGSDILCYGDCSGSITPGASGGTNPYTFTYSGGSNTNLCKGTYTSYVTDGGGCVDSTDIFIDEPAAPLTITVSAVDVSCYGTSNGSATVSADGGSPSYNYSWSTNPVETAPSALNLGPNKYIIKVTDLNGCTAMDSVTLTQPTQILTSSAVTQTVSCYGAAEGAANMTSVSGGVPGASGYNYSWAPSGETTTASSALTAGTHTVYISDSLGCTVPELITINGPLPFTATATQTNQCGGPGSGAVTVNAFGGDVAGGYQYMWTPGGATTKSVSNLNTGTYTVVVTDANSCTASDTVDVILTPPITTSVTSSNLACASDSNGTASVIASGGSGAFTYLWSPTGDTIPSLTGLQAGTYSITVTDSVGCMTTTTVNVGGATLFTASTTNEHICGTGVGSSTVSATGGTPSYSYSWSTGSTTTSITGLAPGNYYCIATDSVGCVDSIAVTIHQSVDLSVIGTTTDIRCYGDSNGVIDALGAGGIKPYTFVWAPGGDTTSSISGLGPGNYTITITDSIGCTSNNVISLTNPAPVTSTVTSSNVSTSGGSDGSATAAASGGNGQYLYSWSNGATTSSVSGLTAGSYTVCISDTLGCGDTCTTVTITEPPSGILANEMVRSFSVKPVPFNSSMQVSFETTGNERLTVELKDLLGRSVYIDALNGKQTYLRTIETEHLPNGVYFINIRSDQQLIVTQKVIKTTQ